MDARKTRKGAGPSAPKIADVAKAAGVSPATVSRCLNAPASVRPDKRSRVEAAITSLGYRPLAAAQALASRRTRMVGAVFPRLNSILFGSFFGALHDRLDAAGYILVVATSQYDVDAEERHVRALIARGVEALILVGHDHRPGVSRVISQSGLPVISTWAWLDGADVPQIGFSNAGAMSLVIDYLADLGHRRLGLISGHAAWNDRAAGRIAGAHAAAARHGLDLPDDAVEEVAFDLEEGGGAFTRLMSRSDAPTAVICGSDLFAFGALREARRMGLRIPRDVSLIGFDDVEIAACTSPALTSVRTPREAMAVRAASSLIACLDEGEPLHSVRLETELVVRESSGRPRPVGR